ncbi:MAG: type III-A CRISPR-associated protein Csm2 [Synergistetes bacterium]|nr:type III-A CRISPR-associated protein Csm2 [Synergistota bacterium]
MGRGGFESPREGIGSLKEFIKENALRINSITDPDVLNKFCEKVRRFAKWDKANYRQIRNIYNAIKSINSIEELIKLRPILAYIGARNDIRNLTDFLEDLIRAIRNNKELMSFKKFMEMFICYKRVERN